MNTCCQVPSIPTLPSVENRPELRLCLLFLPCMWSSLEGCYRWGFFFCPSLSWDFREGEGQEEGGGDPGAVGLQEVGKTRRSLGEGHREINEGPNVGNCTCFDFTHEGLAVAFKQASPAWNQKSISSGIPGKKVKVEGVGSFEMNWLVLHRCCEGLNIWSKPKLFCLVEIFSRVRLQKRLFKTENPVHSTLSLTPIPEVPGLLRLLTSEERQSILTWKRLLLLAKNFLGVFLVEASSFTSPISKETSMEHRSSARGQFKILHERA